MWHEILFIQAEFNVCCSFLESASEFCEVCGWEIIE